MMGPEPQHLPIKVYSEYTFPLPPRNIRCSHSPASSPRSPFPPPYSTLTPAASAYSFKETVPEKNNNSSFIKRSVHAVGPAQLAPNAKQISQCKPLPDRPHTDTDKPEHGNKIWKQKICRLTPVQNGGTYRDVKTPCRIDPNGIMPGRQAPPSRAMTSSGDPSPIFAKNWEKTQGDHSKRVKSPGIKHQYVAGTDVSNSRTLIGSSGPEEASCADRERLTFEETLWLHRNYRGEATFLKAWGLHITRSADRKRGLEIMRELMAAESPRGNERRIREHYDVTNLYLGLVSIAS
ncbi:hypothetical protein F5B19DRAFT_481012 [Rostrohypoxylon terebratum]|nr:hypothetical protein F5B19DRAFT_481012 [Rostrohypoxylon terebratum]